MAIMNQLNDCDSNLNSEGRNESPKSSRKAMICGQTVDGRSRVVVRLL